MTSSKSEDVSLGTAEAAAEQAVIRAALKFDDVMTEFEGDLRYCHEYMDGLFAAIARLRVIRNLGTYPTQQWLNGRSGAHWNEPRLSGRKNAKPSA